MSTPPAQPVDPDSPPHRGRGSLPIPTLRVGPLSLLVRDWMIAANSVRAQRSNGH
jgi:hypothetical protein